MMKDNIATFESKDVKDMRVLLGNMKRMLPQYAELAIITAEIRRVNYDALIEQKFTPEEALVLCQNTAL